MRSRLRYSVQTVEVEGVTAWVDVWPSHFSKSYGMRALWGALEESTAVFR